MHGMRRVTPLPLPALSSSLCLSAHVPLALLFVARLLVAVPSSRAHRPHNA